MSRVHPENDVAGHPVASSPSHDSNVAVGVASNNISKDNDDQMLSTAIMLGEQQHVVVQGGLEAAQVTDWLDDQPVGPAHVHKDVAVENVDRILNGYKRGLPLWDAARNAASLLLWFVAAGFVAAAPKAIVLLIINGVVAQVPASQALSDFKSMWAPCKDPKNLFPAYSPGGQVYKWLFTANDAFVAMGLTIMHVCETYQTARVGDWAKGTWKRTLFSMVYYLYCGLSFLNFTHQMALHPRLHKITQVEPSDTAMDKMYHHHNQTMPTEQSGTFLRQSHLWMKAFLDVLITLWLTEEMLLLLLRFVLRRRSDSRSSDLLRMAIFYCVASRVSFGYVQLLVDGFLHGLHMVVPLSLAKVCTTLARFVLLRNLKLVDEEGLVKANMIFLLIGSFTSFYVRGNEYDDSNLLNVVVVSLTILAVEVVGFCWACFLNVTWAYNHCFKRINSKTLVEILESHRLYQRLLEIFYAELLLGELLEISIIICIDVCQLLSPVWTQHGLWTSLDHFSGPRRWNVVRNLLVRLSIQVASGIVFMCVSSRLFPVRGFHMQIIFKSKTTIFFWFGVMLTLVTNFFPKCQTCEDPQVCLVYTQCLKYGRVMLEGSDLCHEDFMWSSVVVESLLNTTNVSMSDLACGRNDVTCHDVEDLKRRGCAKDSFTTNQTCTVHQYSHEFDDEWPSFPCKEFFCLSEFDWLPSG